MSPLFHIRRDVLCISQVEMGEIVGASQATISRWEAGTLEPDRAQLARIRREVKRRKLKWKDAWLFEPYAPVHETGRSSPDKEGM
jgi:transcriptional regulator with XRE-family HTH domain